MVAKFHRFYLSKVLVFGIAFIASGIANAADVVLLDFSSTSCAPCQEMRPVVQRIAAAGYKVRHIDIVREPELAAQFKVDQVPTFISLVDGREYARMTGTGSFENLQQILSPPAVRGQSPDLAQQAPASPIETSAASAPVANPFAQQSPIAPPSSAPVASSNSPNRAALLEATVKISVQDADGSSAGTGTIVDARDGAALVLTCGHLFRTSAGKGPIEVTFYQATPAGAQARETVPGQVLNYDLERDLALVVVRTQSAVKALPIAPLNTPLAPGAAVSTVGCNGGADPTILDSKITTIDRYQGPPNVEVAGAPVEGRSGGGLFNAVGQLIGVCFAADPQSNEGLYASLPSIQEKLNSLNLAMVYQSPVTGPTTPGREIDIASAEVSVRGQDELVDRLPDAFASVPNVAAPASMTEAEKMALAEIQRRGINSEVICIIRPHDLSGKSEVITLNNVSPGFVAALAPNGPETNRPSSATAAAGRLLR